MDARLLDVSLNSEADTAALGARVAAVCAPGDVITLTGGLGAGKTTLARALIRTLMGEDVDVPSPTFTLVQTYPAPDLDIWHFDLYRLQDPREARELGLDESADGLCLIEWPERLGGDLPPGRLDISLSFAGDGRIARLSDHSDWSNRLGGDWR